MKKDDHGYINNVGASKYWGVTTSVVKGQRLWIVNIHPKWSEKTLKFRATDSYKLTEVDAARIAAFFYDVQCFSTKKQSAQYVISACGRWVYVADVENSQIRREVYRNQLCYNNNQTIADLFFLAKSDEVASSEENKKIVKLLDELDKPSIPTERELVALITDGILNKIISPTGARLLIGALEQAI